jgi:hypothetical protein
MAVWQGMVGSWRRPPFSDGRCRRLPGQGAVCLRRLRLYGNADTTAPSRMPRKGRTASPPEPSTPLSRRREWNRALRVQCPRQCDFSFCVTHIDSSNKCDTIILWISASPLRSELPPGNTGGWTSLMPGWCSPAAPSPFRTRAVDYGEDRFITAGHLAGRSGHFAARRVALYP